MRNLFVIAIVLLFGHNLFAQCQNGQCQRPTAGQPVYTYIQPNYLVQQKYIPQQNYISQQNYTTQTNCTQTSCNQTQNYTAQTQNYSSQQSYTVQYSDNSRLIALVNNERSKRGLRNVSEDTNLSSFSTQWSSSMSSRQVMEHSSRYQHNFTSVGGSFEVVGMNARTADEMFAAWMRSSPHAAALMNPNVSSIGVGRSGNAWTGVLK